MDVLGVSAGHDLGACFVRDGAIVACIEEERLTRFKNGLPVRVRDLWSGFNGRFGYFPWASVEYCLKAGRIDLSGLDSLVLSAAFPASVVDIIPLRDKTKIVFGDQPAGGDHHFMHALSGFFASPFQHAAVLVVDGTGTTTVDGYEAESGYHFFDREGRYRQLFKNRYAGHVLSGLGWMYDLVSSILGFTNLQLGYLAEPGKTMALAPYGATDSELAEKWVEARGYHLTFKGFHDFLDQSGLITNVSFSSRDKALVRNENRISRQARNLAAKVQAELEAALLHLVRELHAETRERVLCLAGGVALNSVANGLLARSGSFERIFVQPAAADNGQAIGLAYYGYMNARRRARPRAAPIAPMRDVFGGRVYSGREVARLLRRCALQPVEFASDRALVEDAARELANGAIVGWFQGGSEFGPRALGHRSILADPRGALTRDYLNAHVKFRESFRPFAPSVLLERAAEIFELKDESPYMLVVVPVREAWASRLPAVTHVDGTARVQTVSRDVDPLYHALIAEFELSSNVPVLLNTSFNIRGMPIVESPRDAVGALLFTDLDAVYLGRLKVTRPSLAHLRPSFSAPWRFSLSHCLERGREDVEAALQLKEGGGRPTRIGDPTLARFLQHVNGRRSMQSALRAALGRTPTTVEARAVLTQTQALLRKGVLQLQVGDITF